MVRGLIQRRLSEPHSVEFVRRLVEGAPGMHRTDLADRLCGEFGFVDARGVRQRSGCLKVLRAMEEKGLFTLPPPRTRTGRGGPRRLGRGVPPPEGVPETAGMVRDLDLVLVETEDQMRMWNEMLIAEHHRGAGPLVGRQLRYLVGSGHGWLGGLAFASAALQVRDRDRWIGWDAETRRAHLDRVVGLARFLIRPSARCRNLASRVLGMVMKRLSCDFEVRYGYRPWLVETFVDTSRFLGTCYQAANWIRVGCTRGRGRQDRDRRSGETVKDIYLYPLVEDFRDRMGLAAHSGLGPLPVEAGLGADWAEHEFGGAPLGDGRLSKRLVRSAALQAENPGRALSGVAQGDWAMVKGHYRFIDQPDESAVTMENILLPHREQTLRRMQAEKTVLCIQDRTTLDYNGLAECDGLGTISKNQTGAKSRGLHLHSTLAVTDEGVPLGVLRTQCWAPMTRAEKGEKRKQRAIPIEEKESYCWVQGLRDLTGIAAGMPHTRIVSVMDREADFFELFDEWRRDSGIDLLVRAQHNRRTAEARFLFDAIRETEPQLRFNLYIGRQSARPKRSKQKARPRRAERIAEVALRYHRIEMSPPDHIDRDPVPLWMVHVAEEDPPQGVKPIEWFLLTTLEIESPQQAERCLAWYCLRWRIEDWYRVLKTGCRIEELGHKTAQRLMRGIAINAVIAWRIMLMTLLGRETPDLPAEVLFSDIEIEVLKAFADQRNLKPPTKLHDAVHLVAKLGGYLSRKHDPPPGHQLMWYGYVSLRMMCMGYMLRGP